MLKEIIHTQLSFQISKTETNKSNTVHPTNHFTLCYTNKHFRTLSHHQLLSFTIKPITHYLTNIEHHIERTECFSINKVYIKFKKLKLNNIKRNTSYAIETTNSFEMNIKYEDSNSSCNSTCNTFSNLLFKSMPLIKSKCEYCYNYNYEMDVNRIESKYEKIKNDLNDIYPYIKHNDITRELIFRRCSDGIEDKYLFIKNLYNSLSMKQHNHNNHNHQHNNISTLVNTKSTKITIRSRSKGAVNEHKRTFNTIYK